MQDMSLAMKGGHLVRSSVKGSSAYLVKVEESRAIKVSTLPPSDQGVRARSPTRFITIALIEALDA